MTRRRQRTEKRCDAHARVVYRSWDHATRVAVGLYDLVPGARLAVYYCESARAWHVTTHSFKAGMVKVGA